MVSGILVEFLFPFSLQDDSPTGYFMFARLSKFSLVLRPRHYFMGTGKLVRCSWVTVIEYIYFSFLTMIRYGFHETVVSIRIA